MAIDPRLSEIIPQISPADAKDPNKVSVWMNRVAAKLNALTVPKFITKRFVNYKINIIEKNNALIKVDGVGFPIGGIVLVGAWNQAGSPMSFSFSNTPLAVERPFYISDFSLTGSGCQFRLMGGQEMAGKDQTVTFTVMLVEATSNNNNTASNSNSLNTTLQNR